MHSAPMRTVLRQTFPADLRTLPPRIDELTVRALAGGYSRGTLRKRQAAGLMPRHVDRGRYLIYDRDQVLEALKLTAPPAEVEDPWLKALENWSPHG